MPGFIDAEVVACQRDEVCLWKVYVHQLLEFFNKVKVLRMGDYLRGAPTSLGCSQHGHIEAKFFAVCWQICRDRAVIALRAGVGPVLEAHRLGGGGQARFGRGRRLVRMSCLISENICSGFSQTGLFLGRGRKASLKCLSLFGASISSLRFPFTGSCFYRLCIQM